MVPCVFLLLLPPSEGKAPNPPRRPRTRSAPLWAPDSGRFSDLGPTRHKIADALALAMGNVADAGALLGVGGTHLERARAANCQLLTSPTMAAANRYTGVVHDHLDLATLASAHRSKARRSVVIFSGLAGVVGIDDPLPDYRIKMGASLPGIGPLARMWRPLINAQLAVQQPRLVLDLLPKEHAGAWSPEIVGVPVIRVQFQHIDAAGNRKIIGHDAKAAKGLLARHVITSADTPKRAVTTFTHDGWRIDSISKDAGITQINYIRQTG